MKRAFLAIYLAYVSFQYFELFVEYNRLVHRHGMGPVAIRRKSGSILQRNIPDTPVFGINRRKTVPRVVKMPVPVTKYIKVDVSTVKTSEFVMRMAQHKVRLEIQQVNVFFRFSISISSFVFWTKSETGCQCGNNSKDKTCACCYTGMA